MIIKDKVFLREKKQNIFLCVAVAIYQSIIIYMTFNNFALASDHVTVCLTVKLTVTFEL